MNNLSERASNLWEHVHNAAVVIRHATISASVLAVAAGGIFLLLEARSAVKQYEAESAARAVVAKAPAVDIPPAPPKTTGGFLGIGGHTSRPLEPAKLPPPPTQAAPPEPGSTPANPHPSVTVPQLRELPYVQFFMPKDEQDTATIESDFSVKVQQTPPITQRLRIDSACYGVDIMGFVAAGGGSAFLRPRYLERPFTNFHPVLWIGAGGVLAGGGGLPGAYGGTVHLGLELARIGDVHLHIGGDWDILASGVKTRAPWRATARLDWKLGSND